VFLQVEWAQLADVAWHLIISICDHGMVDEQDGWRVLQDVVITAATVLPATGLCCDIATVEHRRFELVSAQAVCYELLQSVLSLASDRLDHTARVVLHSFLNDNVLALVGYLMDQVFWTVSGGVLRLHGIELATCISPLSNAVATSIDFVSVNPASDPIGPVGGDGDNTSLDLSTDAPADGGHGAAAAEEPAPIDEAAYGECGMLARPMLPTDTHYPLACQVAAQLVSLFGELAMRRSVWPRGATSLQHSPGTLLGAFTRLAIWQMSINVRPQAVGSTVGEQASRTAELAATEQHTEDLLQLVVRHPQCSAQTTQFAFLATVSLFVGRYSALVAGDKETVAGEWDAVLRPASAFIKFVAQGHGIRHHGELCRAMHSLQGTTLVVGISVCFRAEYAPVALAMHFASQQWDALLATQGATVVAAACGEAWQAVRASAVAEELLLRQLASDWAAAQLLRPEPVGNGHNGSGADPTPVDMGEYDIQAARHGVPSPTRLGLCSDTEGLQAAASLAWRRALSILANERGVWSSLAATVRHHLRPPPPPRTPPHLALAG